MLCEVDPKTRDIHIQFDGVDDVMRTVSRYTEPQFAKEVMYNEEVFTEPCKWNNYHTLDMVKKELLEPTPKMADTIKSGEAMFDSEDWATQKPRRKVLRRLEEGDEINTDRWLMREPDMWEESHKVEGARFGVRIGVNVATSAHVGVEGFKWRTSAVIAILNICEELVVPCEVICYKQIRNFARIDGRSHGLLMEFPVKRAEQLLDIDLLGYVLGSLAFYRNAIIGAQIIACKSRFGASLELESGLGTPHEYTEAQANEFILSRACLDEYSARSEVERFVKWLKAIREQSKYNMDGLEDIGNY